MIVLKLENVFFYPANSPPMKAINWTIKRGEKLGLVGTSSFGKSTLLKLMAGILQPDSGTLFIPETIQIAYLSPEAILIDDQQEILTEVLIASPTIAKLYVALQEIEETLADHDFDIEGEEKAYHFTLKKREHLVQAFKTAKGFHYVNLAKTILQQLGFSEDQFNLPTQMLDYGQKKLLLLAKEVITQPNILLLDEPDSHLDLETKKKLEKFIRNYPGAIVIVSQDRYLLDEVVDGIVELEAGDLDFFPDSSYSAYIIKKKLQQFRQMELRYRLSPEKVRLKAAIARMELWVRMVDNERHLRQARNKRRQLGQLESLKQREEKTKVLEVINLFKAVKGKLFIADFNLTLWSGQRVGVLSSNPLGRKFLFQCLIGDEMPTGGAINIRANITMGVYPQMYEHLNPDKTMLETVQEIKPITEAEATTYLEQFGFSSWMATTYRISDLKRGERCCLQIGLILLNEPELLLMKSPTAFLDIHASEALEAVLNRFKGALLVIAEDRYFLDKAVDRLIELSSYEGVATEYEGGYTDYAIAKKKISAAQIRSRSKDMV